MKVDTETCEGLTILHLHGEFDRTGCPQFLEEIERLVRDAAARIAVNAQFVRFIDSAALGAIIKASKQITSGGGKLVISEPSRICRDVMEKVALQRLVPIHDTDADALADLREQT